MNTPKCPACGHPLEVDDEEFYFCDNKRCEEYDSTAIHLKKVNKKNKTYEYRDSRSRRHDPVWWEGAQED